LISFIDVIKCSEFFMKEPALPVRRLRILWRNSARALTRTDNGANYWSEWEVRLVYLGETIEVRGFAVVGG
jgi:hypothetical protein